MTWTDAEAQRTVDNVQALRSLLAEIFPPALKEAIDRERQVMQDESDRWESYDY